MWMTSRCPANCTASCEARGNLSYRFERGDKPAVDAAFAAAAHIVEIELFNNRLVVAPIEPRAAIGTYDAAADHFDLLLTGQGVHSLRQQLAEAVFNMPPDRITVRAPDVGVYRQEKAPRGPRYVGGRVFSPVLLPGAH